MRISKTELHNLIKEELGHLEYPADEMVAITTAIFSLADSLGLSTTPDQRDEIVDEIEGQIYTAGYHFVQEQLRLGGTVRLFINSRNTPQFYGLLNQMQQEDSSAFGEVEDYFAEGGLTVSLKAAPDSRPAPPAAPPAAEPRKPPAAPPKDDDDSWFKDMFGSDDDDDDSWLKDMFGSDDDEETTLDEPEGLPQPPDDEDLTDTEVDLPPVDVPEEEEDYSDALKVDDIVRVTEEGAALYDDGGVPAGDYKVESVYEKPQSGMTPDLLVALLRPLDEETGELLDDDAAEAFFGEEYTTGTTIIVKDIADSPDLYKINPFKFPKIPNPWKFKWFWEEEEDEDAQPGWMKKAVKSVKGMLAGSSTSIKVLGGLTGVAGIVGLMKYLAKDEEKVNDAAALKKGEDLKDLGTVAPANHWAFVTETLKFILSLTLDKEQMKTVETVEEVIRLGLVFVHSDDPKRQKEIDASIYKALDQVPGIEWIDKLPGGRERIVEIIRERWMEMSTKDKISFIVALLPQDVVERLEALIPGPELDQMDMRWPETREELGDWLGGELVAHQSFSSILFAAAEMFGLLDSDQLDRASDILEFTDEVLRDAKDDSNIERMMKIMDVLFEHKKQLSRMKVLAGVR